MKCYCCFACSSLPNNRMTFCNVWDDVRILFKVRRKFLEGGSSRPVPGPVIRIGVGVNTVLRKGIRQEAGA